MEKLKGQITREIVIETATEIVDHIYALIEAAGGTISTAALLFAGESTAAYAVQVENILCKSINSYVFLCFFSSS